MEIAPKQAEGELTYKKGMKPTASYRAPAPFWLQDRKNKGCYLKRIQEKNESITQGTAQHCLTSVFSWGEVACGGKRRSRTWNGEAGGRSQQFPGEGKDRHEGEHLCSQLFLLHQDKVLLVWSTAHVGAVFK